MLLRSTIWRVSSLAVVICVIMLSRDVDQEARCDLEFIIDCRKTVFQSQPNAKIRVASKINPGLERWLNKAKIVRYITIHSSLHLRIHVVAFAVVKFFGNTYFAIKMGRTISIPTLQFNQVNPTFARQGNIRQRSIKIKARVMIITKGGRNIREGGRISSSQ